MSGPALPDGYARITVDRTEAVAVPELVPPLRRLLSEGTIYDFARRRKDARTLAGRQPAYAIPIPVSVATPDAEWIVVRHNRHGGMLAALTSDRFRYPTRAPLELEISARLQAAGVPTPAVLAYAVYRSGPFARADVVTALVEPSHDLAAGLSADATSGRQEQLDAAATLVAALARAGAIHHDLNAKNVLIGREAMVLDVDRVSFGHEPRQALERNLDRLERSLRKLRGLQALRVTDEEVAALRKTAERRL